MFIAGNYEDGYIGKSMEPTSMCAQSQIESVTTKLCPRLLGIASNDSQLLRYHEPDFNRLSLQLASQKVELINQAFDMISRMKASGLHDNDDVNCLDEKTLANLEYLLLRWRGLLCSAIADKVRKQLCDELKKQQQTTANGSQTSGDKSCSEYSSGKRPLNTTWPWSIKPSLAVLWGVCWMFEMAGMYPDHTGGWSMNPVKAEEYGYPPLQSSSAAAPRSLDDSALQSLISAAATSSASANHMNGITWIGGSDSGVSLTNQITSNTISARPSGSALPLTQLLAAADNTTHIVSLPPHPSGQHLSIALEAVSQPQAASLEASVHHHQHRASISTPSASRASNSLISPVASWAPNNLTTSDHQGLGIQQSPRSTAASPYRQYNPLTNPTRTPPTCVSPAAQTVFGTAAAQQGTWSQPQAASSVTAYRDPTTPSTPGYLHHHRHSLDGSVVGLGGNLHSSDFGRHQHAIPSGSDYSPFNISTLSYPSSPALTHMESLTADAVLAARTVADMSNVANGHLDDSMDDTLDGFSVRRGHTHKRNEDPPRDDQGKMMCRFQNSCAGISFERKCEWSKHMDKHERPYKCEAPGCEKLQGFTYSGGLLRHQREVHKMHGGTKEPLHCPFENCKRAGGSGFTRKENLQEHIRRVHRRNTDGLELLAGSKRDLETLELTDPLLRDDMSHDMVPEVGDENIDPNVSNLAADASSGATAPTPAKRRRTHINGGSVDVSLDLDLDYKELPRRLLKENDSLKREVQSLSERVDKLEAYIGRRMMLVQESMHETDEV